MIRRLVRWTCVFGFLFLAVRETPAPLIFRPGEGWFYEAVGGGKWVRGNAKDQLEVAKQAFEAKDYSLASKAARRLVRTWPLADYAAEAQYLLARSLEERGRDQKAFEEYQNLLVKFPKAENYTEVLKRQFTIAGRFLAGQWFRLWGVIPFFPSMDKTVVMYEKIIKNGPYSEVAPDSQMSIGTAREKQRKYHEAVKAYEAAADRYHDQPEVAANALFKAGLAYNRQAKTAEYDQSVAGKAIATFTDFMALYPEDPRVPEAQNIINGLKTEQARGNFQIARFYEKKKRWDGALVYYNEVLVKDPNSKFADLAKNRIAAITRDRQPAAEAR